MEKNNNNRPPGWFIPPTPQNTKGQEANAQSAATAPSAPSAATAPFAGYPQLPAYDDIFQGNPAVIGQQRPIAPPATYMPHQQAPVYAAPQATPPKHNVAAATQFKPAQYYSQPPPQNAQPQAKLYSQPAVTSGNRPQVMASMAFSSSTMDLDAQNWVSFNQVGLPANAFKAGHDIDGSPLFICRVAHAGDILPGKFVVNHKCAYVPYDGKENASNSFEILVGNRYRWETSHNGKVPPNAVEGGRTKSGEKLFIGRVSYKNSLTPGKIHPSHKCLYIPFGGRELNFTTYEVLLHA